METERNSWDRSNQQGQNMDPENSEDQFLKEGVETNPNKDADGYGSESARSDHSGFDAGMGSRKGNNHTTDHKYVSSRSHENLSDGNSGGSGRSHG